jgi:hypothetical protein
MTRGGTACTPSLAVESGRLALTLYRLASWFSSGACWLLIGPAAGVRNLQPAASELTHLSGQTRRSPL